MYKLRKIFILLLILLSFSCVSYSKPTEIIYLIPEGFTGGVIILYNQPDGITPEKTDDGKIIFHVPKDGLIKVKEPLERTAYRLTYFFVDEKGNRTPIEYLYPNHSGGNPGDPSSREINDIKGEEAKNKVFVLQHRTTNFNVAGERVYVHNFIVEKPVIALRTFLKTSDRIFDIQKEMLIKEKAGKEKQQR